MRRLFLGLVLTGAACRTVPLPAPDEPTIALSLYTPQPLICGQATELELSFANGTSRQVCLCPQDLPTWTVEADSFTHASEHTPVPLDPKAPPLCIPARSSKTVSAQFVPRRHSWQRVRLSWTLGAVNEACSEKPVQSWPLEAAVEGSVICPP